MMMIMISDAAADYDDDNLINRGVHPSEAMMHFPPVSDSPYFLKNFGLRGKFPQFYLFPRNFSIFIRQNFWRPFFPQISNFPPISLFQFVSHYIWKFFFSPTFANFPPDCVKFMCFLHTLHVFRFPPTFTMMHLCNTQCTYWTPLMVNDDDDDVYVKEWWWWMIRDCSRDVDDDDDDARGWRMINDDDDDKWWW